MSIDWADRYSVGISVLDYQHENMLTLCNTAERLLAEADAAKAKAELRGLLTDMHRCAKEHFSTEEQLLSQHGYQEVSKHQKDHDEYVAELARFISLAEEGKLSMKGVFVHMSKWWVNHILVVDMQYKDFLAKAIEG